jgi:hypothetical protein
MPGRQPRSKHRVAADGATGEGYAPAAERRGDLPRLLYTREESAQALGMSLSHFQRHVQPHIPCVYVGQLRQYRPEDLRAWAEREASERR